MKRLKKILHFFISPYFLGILVTLGACYITLIFYEDYQEGTKLDRSPLIEMLGQIHEKTIDWRLRDRGPKYGHQDVAVLAIDDRSIELEGRWPWPRNKTGLLVKKAVENGAKLVGFDIVFSETDPNSSIPTLRRLRQRLKEANTLTPQHVEMFEEEIKKANSDQAFGDIIAKIADNLVLGTYFDPVSREDGRYALRDACITVYNKRTPSHAYWAKEEIQQVANDTALVRLPSAMADHLGNYFTRLELEGAKAWIAANPSSKEWILRAFEGLETEVPEDFFPAILNLWNLQDVNTVTSGFGEAIPSLAKAENVNTVFSRLSWIIPSKQAAELGLTLADVAEQYCVRFLRNSDELASPEAYQKFWGNLDQFDDWKWDAQWDAIKQSDNRVKSASFSEFSDLLHEQSKLNLIENASRFWLNIDPLAKPTKHTGFFNAKQDGDGSIRREWLIAREGNEYMSSLAFKMFLVANKYSVQIDISPDAVDDSLKVVQALKIIDNESLDTVLKIPVDTRGQLPINYAGPSYMFPYVSAADILSDNEEITIDQAAINPENGRWGHQAKKVNKKEFLKNKLLVLGATSTGIYDLRVTPFEENYPGVETHANLLSNLMVANEQAKGKAPPSALGFMRTHPDEQKYMQIAMLVLGLTLTTLLSYFGSVLGLTISATTMFALYAFDKYFLFNKGIVVAVFFPAILISGLFVVLTFYKYFTEERKKRELKGTFEKYVSPAIVNEILSDPTNIELGGKKMEMSVFFSDVRGFTTISEKLDPRALSDLLNSYLTPMTELVFANKGTLDKYMGDAVMAFFGAPIHYADHAKQACRCALASLVKLKELQAQYRAQGLPEIDIGIGINTGEMSVGNMGSNTVRSYTVMGDSVNLGSRLEGINKQYGTRIIISEFTEKALNNEFIVREIDWVKVKGKNLPIRIFELIGEGKPDAKTSEMLQHWNEGFKLYHEKNFKQAIDAFTNVINGMPTDEASKLYIERCQDYLQEPPPDDWDGVFTMKTK